MTPKGTSALAPILLFLVSLGIAPRGSGEDSFRWSEPAKGLLARIEYCNVEMDNIGHYVFVRLKNISEEPIFVPTGNPTTVLEEDHFTLSVLRGDGWRRARWLPKKRLGVCYLCQQGGNFVKRPTITLGAGESAIVFLCGSFDFETRRASMVKIRYRFLSAGASRDSGEELETPAFPMYLSETQSDMLRGRLKFPDHFPAFSRERFHGGCLSGMESDFYTLSISNHDLSEYFPRFERRRAVSFLEDLMLGETDEQMKLFFAYLAARAGSTMGKHFILDCYHGNHKAIVSSSIDAMKSLAREKFPPDWAVDCLVASLSDDRELRGRDRRRVKVCNIAGNESVPYFLGWEKCTRAAPRLIELIRQGFRGYIRALSDMGDERVVSLVKKSLEELRGDDRYGLGRTLARAAGRFGIKEAVPYLMDGIRHEWAIDALGRIGDPRAIPILQALVASKGQLVHKGEPYCPSGARERMDRARISLALLAEDPIPPLLELLSDSGMGTYNRERVLRHLERMPDPRAVPRLVDVIRKDRNGNVIYGAIRVLPEFRYMSAVTGLIDCVSLDFKDKRAGKWTYNGKFNDRIAQSLRLLTGQSIGADQKLWRRWWKSEGWKRADLK